MKKVSIDVKMVGENPRCGPDVGGIKQPFSVGQILRMRIHDSEDLVRDISDEKSITTVPVMVTGINVGSKTSGPPSYNLVFTTRWSSGEPSGTIEMSNVCLWRYVDSYILKNPDSAITALGLSDKEDACAHYLSEEDGEFFIVYPFR